MITILISIALGIIIGILRKGVLDRWDSYSAHIWGWIFYGLVAGIFISACVPANTEVNTHVIYIETMSDNSSSEGSFFLGSGQVEGVWKYTYYSIRRDGSYQLGSLDVENVSIRYINNATKPRIQWTQKEMIDFKGINMFSTNLFGSAFHDSRKTIYVPKGSISSNYKFDAN